ncbi:MAG: pilus assembly protein [Caldilineales bacterium]|nr:pilus assembly protein [Caldilineales bacterium]
MTRFLGSERATSMVEFALVLPMLILLLSSVLDLSRAMYTHTALQAAAQEGARYGIIAPNDANGIQSTAQQALIGLDPARTSFAVTRPSSDQVAVEIRYDFPLATPLIALLFDGNGLELRGTARMLLY